MRQTAFTDPRAPNLILAKQRIEIGGESFDFYFRPGSHADLGAIQQIFQNKDYAIEEWTQGKCLASYYETRKARGEKALIVDAGANIGAASVYLSKIYGSSAIYAVEPEKSNIALLKINTENLAVEIFEGAIAADDGVMYLQNPDASSWAFQVAERESGIPVQTVAPTSLMASAAACGEFYPLIFKIDIEGGEQVLFKKDIEWMNLFPLIIIELHDWMLPFQGSSRSFMKALADFDFDIVYKGENMFCFNRKILSAQV